VSYKEQGLERPKDEKLSSFVNPITNYREELQFGY